MEAYWVQMIEMHGLKPCIQGQVQLSEASGEKTGWEGPAGGCRWETREEVAWRGEGPMGSRVVIALGYSGHGSLL